MAAPAGNQNAKNAKRWQQALRRALARKSNQSVEAGLDAIADLVVAAAYEGEQWAIREVGEREDGKPAQAIVGDPDADPIQIAEIVIRAVDADRSTAQGG
jgi:hypothetical protein